MLAAAPDPARGMTHDEFQGRLSPLLAAPAEVEDMRDILRLCRKALASGKVLDPAYLHDVHFHMGFAYANLGEADKALSAMSKAVALDSEKFLSYIIMARAYEQTGDTENRIRYLYHAAERAPSQDMRQALRRQAENLRLITEAVPPRALWTSFSENRSVADGLYKNSTIAVSGVVSAVTSGEFGEARVQFYIDRLGIGKVTCIFPNRTRDELFHLKTRHSVIVAGECLGMDRKNVILQDCRIMPMAAVSS